MPESSVAGSLSGSCARTGPKTSRRCSRCGLALPRWPVSAEAFRSRAYDQVPFQLADSKNTHTNDPERTRGQILDLELGEDGLYALAEVTGVEAGTHRQPLHRERHGLLRISVVASVKPTRMPPMATAYAKR